MIFGMVTRLNEIYMVNGFDHRLWHGPIKRKLEGRLEGKNWRGGEPVGEADGCQRRWGRGRRELTMFAIFDRYKQYHMLSL